MEGFYREKYVFNVSTVLGTHFSFQQRDNLTAKNNFYLLSKVLTNYSKAFQKMYSGLNLHRINKFVRM